MAKTRSTKSRNINAKRIQMIENYDLSVGSLINPNIRQQVALNPIGLKVAISTLQELEEELGSYEISIDEIDCNRIFNEGNVDLTETEVFVRSIGNCSYMNYRNDYLKMIEQRELEKIFSVEERKSRILELEEAIKKEVLKGATVGKLNKELRKSCEARAEELRKELNSIEETFNVVDEEYINSMLYMIADRKIKEIKNRLDYKISYLENIMEDIA
ncbi:hypothetical protein [Clostridium perfringens]|jgi:molybdopterin converting factor small subunit|uniref:Uncharacterized protein n=1 Tax=Clostridium perfringens TaxID=1502 RepID=A0AAW9KA57_CLOPF|nr:hypothetical protein [Clostridium perfringens]MDZ4905237.1 hypothetical protein [Clostridium perfringens]MDZ7541398.1 hypothetical protein [Clostridium perfringens]